MKPTNLLSIVDTYIALSDEAREHYLRYKHIKIRKAELADMHAFVRHVQPFGRAICFDHFYVGFQIEQIGKEFDLLRIAENYVVNIEIKSIHTGEKIKRQLQRNRYYLTFLKRPMYFFTYVHEDNTLYELTENDELQKVSPRVVMDLLAQQRNIYTDNVQQLFDVTEYLISPIHHTDAFLAGQYFLNSQQSQFKTRLVEAMLGNEQCVALTGDSGTGKTLLLYDVAKTLYANDVGVLLLQSGVLYSGQHMLNDSGWHILQAQHFATLHENWHETVDVLIIDEAQKLDIETITHILHCIEHYELNAIFAYDPEHFLHVLTSAWHIDETLAPYVTDTLHLTAKFRMHKELLAFIQHLFDASKHAYVENFTRISIEYFETLESTQHYIQTLPRNWQLLNFTAPFDELRHHIEQLSMKELDDVAVVLDATFFHDGGRLTTMHEHAEVLLKMLYYHLTRTRKHIKIIIVNNEPLLQYVLHIVS